MAAQTILCVMAATKGLYGQAFLRQIKAQGARLLVVTNANALQLEWPREVIDGLYGVRDIFDRDLLRNAVSYLARTEEIDRIVGLGEYDIEIAAALREHLRLPGMSLSASYLYRDKLAMRVRAAEARIPVPPFVGLFNQHAIGRYLETTKGPWLVKPRTEASSNGIRRIERAHDLWSVWEDLGDERSHHLLEQFTPGAVYHVDSLVHGGEVRFAAVHRYGTPILDLHRRGGVYTSRAIRRGAPEETALQDLNRQVIQALGQFDGAAHIEYIQGPEGFYFLEASARVGAGLIEEMVEAANGLNLWAEWSKIELLGDRYQLLTPRSSYAGVAICMTHQEHADLGRFEGPGLKVIEPKPYHVALLAQSDDPAEVERMVNEQAAKLERAFLAPV